MASMFISVIIADVLKIIKNVKAANEQVQEKQLKKEKVTRTAKQ
jgi:hypothetical protein